MKRNALAILLILLMSVTLFTGCGGKADTTASEVNAVTIAIASDWKAMDPYQADELNLTQRLVGDGLLALDYDTLEMVPNIISEYSISDDGKVITLTVPEGMKFADGNPVTPDDLKASIEWGMKSSPYSGDYSVFQTVAVEGNNVIINCEKFSSTALFYLTSTFIPIMEKAQIEAGTAESLFTDARPFGLFSVSEYVAGASIKLVRNDGYTTTNANILNKGASPLDEVLVKIIPDGFSRVSGLKSGELDIITYVPGENIAELKADPNIKVIQYATPGMRYLELNRTNPFLSDQKVRQAIGFAINREEIATASNGLVRTAYGFIVPEMLDYNAAFGEAYKTTNCNNVDKAVELLTAAGWKDSNGDGYVEKDGKTLEISLLGNQATPDTKTTTQIMQQQLKAIGVKVNIETMESGYLNDRVSGNNYDAALIGFSWPEPCSILPYIIKDEANLNGNNFIQLSMDAAYIQDKTQREAQLTEAQEVLAADSCFIPVLQGVDAVAYRADKISGLTILPDTDMLFNDVAPAGK